MPFRRGFGAFSRVFLAVQRQVHIFAGKGKRNMNVGVFCSANAGIDSDFFRMTRELGRLMAQKGHTLVFGGCSMGLMEAVARAVRECGGRAVGVVPTIVERGGRVSDCVDEMISCGNLSDRKDIIIARSDILVALPGGVGTLDEIFTALAAASIGYHDKRVILYDMKEFWQPLLRLFDAMRAQGMLRDGFDKHLLVAKNIDEIGRFLD